MTVVQWDTDDIGRLQASAQVMPTVERLWLLEVVLMPKWPRFLFPSEMCLKRSKRVGEIEKGKEKEDPTPSSIWYCFPYEVFGVFCLFVCLTVLSPKWEESERRQERGILFSNDSKENFPSRDAGR